ncbi:tRNA (guanosine(46)-N7)-methyltransferase TrmB [uncultured Pseudoteredinibacter sp.]|uniref:tRNA (guanosine(46)-N7)-methyltransferase TrmB n=1 Tax=uncultured Pseudoteredinibacter sp. TaxID=1641701 RepID=UPI00260B3170|nr:tRNA (guanosine(46)-N7)-methyltransferase TrmB [uncultured Pseudoteredinibacter sp.]
MQDSIFKPEYKDKSIRSFVIRAGRITDGQRKAFEQWWPKYGLSLYSGSQNFDEVFGRHAPKVLEVGFGMGDSLLEMAKAEPEKDFIGIEVHPPGVGRLINNAGNEGVENLRVYMADANDVLEDCVADDSLDRFQLYFPDPWHKKKHNKRRIVNSGFIQKIAAKLNTAGICHMATDWEPYAEHMMETMSAAEQFENTQGEYLFAKRPEFRPITKFERRGDRLGHGVWDLLFKKC